MLRDLLRVLIVPVAVVLVLFGLAAPFAIIYSGAYDVAATRQHTPPVYWALITSLHQSIQAHAAREAPAPPDLRDATRIDQGLVLYEQLCAACHGAPGRAPDALALGMTPPPANLIPAARSWTAGEIFWTVSKGLKMTGMPAWEFRLDEDEIWAVTAFVKHMASLSPVAYEAQRDALMAPARELTGDLAAAPDGEEP
jgi:mono/diheme cytochrome c family protein